MLRPSGGELTLTGGAADATLGEQAHYLGHQDALKPSLTVAENLQFWTRYLGSDDAGRDQRERQSLETWRLATLGPLPAAYLSAGQRRRLSLCRLGAIRRPIWLLDEPTAALDASAQATLGEAMREHLARGGLIIAATHGPLPIPADIDLAFPSSRSRAA